MEQSKESGEEYRTPPQKMPLNIYQNDKSLVKVLFQQQTASKPIAKPAQDLPLTAKKQPSPTHSRPLKRRYTITHTPPPSSSNLPFSLLLSILLCLCLLIFYLDYQSRIATLESNLQEQKSHCQYNYTVNRCEDRSLREQREFCRLQDICRRMEVKEELARRVRAANVVGQSFRGFLEGVGGWYVLAGVMGVIWLMRNRREHSRSRDNGGKVTVVQEYCDCCKDE